MCRSRECNRKNGEMITQTEKIHFREVISRDILFHPFISSGYVYAHTPTPSDTRKPLLEFPEVEEEKENTDKHLLIHWDSSLNWKSVVS